MARIGMVNYINTAPIYEIWKEEISEPDWQVIEAPPSRLNRMLADDALDLGFVSSIEYAARPNRYQILADLSISATGPVGSVFLFSTIAPEELGGKPVLLSGQSDTSVCLLRIILEEFFSIQPDYFRGEIFARRPNEPDPAAVLAIGDEALRLRVGQKYPIQLDLGQVWHENTALPFVFAVFAVREKYLQDKTEEVRRIHQALLTCRNRGLGRLPEICERVAPRIPMKMDVCSSYLQAIEYDLQDMKQQALERFFTLLIKRGEAESRALPLKIFS